MYGVPTIQIVCFSYAEVIDGRDHDVCMTKYDMMKHMQYDVQNL